jgi:periplasmic mercuric ion binding protein
MKKVVRIIAIAALLAAPLMFDAHAQKSGSDKNLVTVTFQTSITCENCVNTIMNGLPKEKGVKDVKTDIDTKTVTVIYQKDKNDTEHIKRSIEKLGFTAKLMENEKGRK